MLCCVVVVLVCFCVRFVLVMLWLLSCLCLFGVFDWGLLLLLCFRVCVAVGVVCLWFV